MQLCHHSMKQVQSTCSTSSMVVAVDTLVSVTTRYQHTRCSMFKITDPADVVYYIEDRTSKDCPIIDPLQPFSTEDEAVYHALKVIGLSVLDFAIIEWKVD